MEVERGKVVKLGVRKSEGELNVITVCYKHTRKCHNEPFTRHVNKNVNNDLIHI